MIAKILALFGYKIVYVCSWGEYKTRYDSIDFHMMRHVHADMSTAPPWAKMVLKKL